jgi:hypothetical protein
MSGFRDSHHMVAAPSTKAEMAITAVAAMAPAPLNSTSYLCLGRPLRLVGLAPAFDPRELGQDPGGNILGLAILVHQRRAESHRARPEADLERVDFIEGESRESRRADQRQCVAYCLREVDLDQLVFHGMVLRLRRR